MSEEKIFKIKNKINILLIGDTGVGKSSLIQCLTNHKLRISDQWLGVTLSVTGYIYENLIFWDTVGLNEGSNGSISPKLAYLMIKRLLSSLPDGINLILFIHKGRISKSFEYNYELFYDIIGDKKIPICLIALGFENHDEPTNCLEIIEPAINKYNFNFKKILTGTCATSENKQVEKIYQMMRNQTKKEVFKLIEENMLIEPIKIQIKSRGLFKKIWNFVGSIFGFKLWINQKFEELLTYFGFTDAEINNEMKDFELIMI